MRWPNMRWITPLGALAALVFAQTAAAAPVSVGDVSLSPAFQTALERDIGPREGALLQSVVAASLSGALQRAGADVAPGAGLTIETTIVDAKPNSPTMQQLANTPGLSSIDSISLGGAELHAVIRTADGRTLGEVDHRRYSTSLFDVERGTGEWNDARRAIRQFANKVAQAYVGLAH